MRERDQEEGHVVLPGETTVGRQVDLGNNVLVPVGPVRDGKFLEVGSVMDVPAAIELFVSGEMAMHSREGGSVGAHKTTEQNPKSASGLAELINFFFETYFPRITPSMSTPGDTWINVKKISKSGHASSKR